MKSFSKQTNKWLLSTLLIAALGSQYYFSVSSKSLGSFEMSSTSAEQERDLKILQLRSNEGATADDKEKGEKRINAEYASKIASEKAALPKPTPQQIELAVTSKSETEAKTVHTVCADCSSQGTISITGPAQTVQEVLAVISAKKPAVAATQKVEATTAKVEEKKPDVVAETPRQRYERIKEEREEAKRLREEMKEQAKEEKEYKKQLKEEDENEKKQAKLDKETEKKTERNEKFAKDADKIASNCKEDLECKVSKFTSLLKSFSGTNKVELFAVTKAYNQIIDKDLRAGLSSAPGTEAKVAALDALNSIMSGLPSEYKSLKVRTIEVTKAAQTDVATTINGLYKEANVLTAEKKTSEALQVRQQAMQADIWFKRDADLILSNLKEGLTSSNDQSTMAYVTNSYMSDIRTMISRLTNSTGVAETTTTVGSRSGRSGNNTVVSGNSVVQNNSTDQLGKVNFGGQTTNRTGSRLGK